MAPKSQLAVIGFPIAHSLSPELHHYWIEKYDLDASYTKIAVAEAELSKNIATITQQGYRGFNITVPHKESMLALLDEKHASVDAVGAVNTVAIKEGRLIGYNTDGGGFIQSIVQQCPDISFAGKAIIILGAGGATRAIIHGLFSAGATDITVINRTFEKAQKLQQDFPKIAIAPWEKRSQLLGGCDLLVNSTSLGMKGKAPLEIDLDYLCSHALVVDIVYNPIETDLLRNAKSKGCTTIDGLGMLIGQAALAFEIWFGIKPESDVALRTKLLARL